MVRRQGIGPVIPTKRDERPNPRFDRAAYGERNKAERLAHRPKQHRAIATRHERLASHYDAL